MNLDAVFYWKVEKYEATVYFNGFEAKAVCNRADRRNFDPAHGIYLALLRAMEKFVRGLEKGGALDEPVLVGFTRGVIKNWPLALMKFERFVRFKHGQNKALYDAAAGCDNIVRVWKLEKGVYFSEAVEIEKLVPVIVWEDAFVSRNFDWLKGLIALDVSE